MDDIVEENTPQYRFIKFIRSQRKDIEEIKNYGKMSFFDMKRIHMWIDSKDIFKDYCVVLEEDKLSTSFNAKKVSVAKLMYHNYIGDLENDKIRNIKRTCNNPNCITLKHMSLSQSD